MLNAQGLPDGLAKAVGGNDCSTDNCGLNNHCMSKKLLDDELMTHDWILDMLTQLKTILK